MSELPLFLRIDNVDTLPDGGPLTCEVDRSGLDIGRDPCLDWTLPDAERYISGKHAEIRYRDGGYWLHDVSTNGTSVNGRECRLSAPHLLQDGDRIHIGHYLIAVELRDEEAPSPAAAESRAGPSPDPRAPAEPDGDESAPAPSSPAGEEGTDPGRLPAEEPEAQDDAPAPGSAPAAAPPEPSALPPADAAPAAPDDASARPGLAGQWAGGEPGAAPPRPAPQPQPAGQGAFVGAFERGAGMPAGSVASESEERFAEELGALFRLVAEHLQAMLLARAETKSAMRSAERTMIGALENNPLKFSPSPEDALRLMFGARTRSYLDARSAVEDSFADLQRHQVQTFAAMQQALQALIDDLDPQKIEGATAPDGGLAGLLGSRRARFWDTYVERFRSRSGRHERGMVDAFMILFAEMYDRQR